MKDLDPQKEMFKKVYDKIVNFKADKQFLMDSAELLGKKYTNMTVRLNQMLKDNGQPSISHFIKKVEKQKNDEKAKEKIKKKGIIMPKSLINNE